jgi:hypothetical protein
MYHVEFTNSCRYFIKGIDQYDTNKLFGVGYFPHHHKESARFGWRYGRKGCILISAYCYVNGARVEKNICSVPINTEVEMYLHVSKHAYQFFVVDGDKSLGAAEIGKSHDKKWGYPLGLYFGGNKTAPHCITVKMKSL